MTELPAPLRSSVRHCVLVIAGLQFFVVLEGSILLPLGPVLSETLRFPSHRLGYLNSTFLFAAAAAGVVGSLVLDRYDRRRVLCIGLFGVAFATALSARVESLSGLLWCRAVAGLCGGPVAAVALAIVGDVTSAADRGRAIGVVAAGSSLSLIVGVPLALALSDAIGWRAMFLSIAAIGFALVGLAATVVPAGLAERTHHGARQAFGELGSMLRDRGTLLLLLMAALVVSSVHMLAANLGTFLVVNLGSPMDDLKYLWMIGGIAGLASSQVTSRVAGRFGVVRVFAVASVLSVVVSFLFFVEQPVGLPNSVLFAAYLVSVSGRLVLVQIMSSLASQPATRGRFMSLAGASNQAASGLMLVVGSLALSTDSRGALVHMEALGGIGIATTVVSAWIAGRLGRSMSALGKH